MVRKTLEVFIARNKRTPTTIIFYRDGVGKGQYDLVIDIEVAGIKRELRDWLGDKCPNLDFILVNKRINDRFFLDNNQKGYSNKPVENVINPESGTFVVDHCTSDSLKDFFMVAQNVTQGTATPTHYTYLNKESGYSIDDIMELTYFQTFNYYNWSGPVKVPAVCQYAHKLAYMVGDSLIGTVHAHLNTSLWFL